MAKVLNRVLDSKLSKHVWKASFDRIFAEGWLPPCNFKIITEIMYAIFVYGRGCVVYVRVLVLCLIT